MPERVGFEVGFGLSELPNKAKEDVQMKMLLMGDFSGSSNQNAKLNRSPLSARKLHPVDVDSFDGLIASLSPQIRLRLGDQPENASEIEFSELEDFHPDALYERLSIFQHLRKLRANLLNPDTRQQALAVFHEVEEGVGETKPTVAEETDEGLFERLLGKKPSCSDSHRSVANHSADQFIRNVVQPYIVKTTDTDLQSYLDSVDDTISSQMRRLLHEPAFQALESAWRSLYRLASGLETGEELKLFLLDITKQELYDDLAEAGDTLEKSALYGLLMESGGVNTSPTPWSLLVADFSFGLELEDQALLKAMGVMASAAGGPFLAAASSELLGCSSLTEVTNRQDWQPLAEPQEKQWQGLRSSAHASWVGLVLPRILLRLPYGPKTDEIDSFDFTEMSGVPERHEDFLWGSPAFASAMLLALAFTENGKSMQPGDILDLDDLPAYISGIGEEKQLMPCAETWLSEATGEAILERGIMPLISYRNRHAVRLLQFRSIALPAKSLSGLWSG